MRRADGRAINLGLANGHTDMRRGMTGLPCRFKGALQRYPQAGDIYVFRGRRGDLVKMRWHDGLRMSLYAKRLERGRFVAAARGRVRGHLGVPHRRAAGV